MVAPKVEQTELPRTVREQLLASAPFRDGLAELARELGRDEAAVLGEVTGYLEEMVTGWSRHLIDLWVRLARLNVRRSYDAGLDLDQSQVEKVRAAAGDGPLVFLPSHKSNL